MDNNNGPLSFDAVISNSDFKRQIDEMEAKIKGMTTTSQVESRKMDGIFKGMLAGAAGAFTIDKALEFRTKLIEVRGEFQKYEAILKNSLGSQQAASDSMKMLTDVASKTPFQLNSLTNSYVKLVNQGFKPSREEIIKLGDLASNTGKDFDQLAEAVIYAQTGEFKRLKEFGIKAVAAGDQIQFSFKGVTTTVQNSADSIQKYMLSLGDMQGVKGSMEAISKTLVGQVSNLEDSITAMFNRIGGQSEGFLSDSISATKYLVDNYEEIAKILGILITTYGAYKTALIATTVLERVRNTVMIESAIAGKTLSTWEALHSATLKRVQAAQALLNGTMLANPYALIAAAIAGLITYMVLFKKRTDEISEAQKEFKKTSTEAVAEVTALFDQLKRTNIGSEERKGIIEQLNSNYGEYLGNLDLDVLSLNEIEKAEKAVSNAMLTRMANQGKTKDLTYITDRKLATLKSISEKTTKQEYDDIIKYIEEGAQKATYTFDQATGKLKPNFTFQSWGKDIDGLLGGLEALAQQEKAVNESWDKILSSMQQPIVATVKTKKTTTPGTDIDKAPILDLTEMLYEMDKSTNDFQENQVKEWQDYFDREVDLWVEAAANEVEAMNLRTAAMANVVAETSTLEDNLYKIRQEYIQKEKDLREANPENLGEHLKILKQNEQAAIDVAKDEAFKRTDIYKKLSEDVIEYGRKELKERIANIKLALNNEKLSTEQIAAFKKELIELDKAVGMNTAKGFSDTADVLASMSDLAGEFNEELSKMISGAADVAKNLSGAIAGFATNNYAQGIVGSISAITSIVNLVTQAKIQKDAEIAKYNEALLEKQKKALEGINEIIERQISLIDKLYGADKNAAYLQSFTKLKDSIVGSLNALDDLTVQMNTFVGFSNGHRGGTGFDFITTSLDNYIKTYKELFQNPNYDPRSGNSNMWINSGQPVLDQINALLEANNQAKESLYEALAKGDITGTDAEQLRLLLDNLEKNTAEFEQLKNQYSEYITGSTYGSIVDTIAQGFEAGKQSAADFAETFESLMKKAMLQALKMKALEAPLAKWYEDFVRMSGDEGGLTSAEMEQLRAQYNLIITGASAQWEELQNLLRGGTNIGANPRDPNALTPDQQLAGAIKGVTEETASIIAGQMNAIRMNQAEMLIVTRDSLMHLANIDRNTFRLYNIEAYLRDFTSRNNSSTNTMIE